MWEGLIGLEMGIVMTSTIIENVTMIMETAVVVMCKFNFALTALATRLFVSNYLLQ